MRQSDENRKVFDAEGKLSQMSVMLMTVLRTEANLYQITRSTGLSSSLYLECLEELIRLNFVVRATTEEGDLFSLTPSGQEILDKN